MADDKLNQDKDKDPEEIEATPGEMTEDDLEQVSGGMESGINQAAGVHFKYIGNLVNGDGAKKNQFVDLPASKTVKL